MSQVVEDLVLHINQQVASLINQGDFNQASSLAVQAFQLGVERLGEQHPVTGTAINNVAYIFYQFGDYQRAEEFYLRAIRIGENTIGKAHQDYAARLTSLAELYRTLGRYAEAEPLLQEALALAPQWEQQDTELITGLWNNLGLLYLDRGEFKQAREYFEQARTRLQNHKEQRPVLAKVLNNLGQANDSLGEFAAAEQLFLESLELRKELYGERSIASSAVLHNLAMLYIEQGHYDDALQLLERVGTIRRELQGIESPEYGSYLSALAHLRFVRGDYAASLDLYQQALSLQKRLFGEIHPDVAFTLDKLATTEWYLSEYIQAEEHYSQAGRILAETLGERHPDFATHLNEVGQFFADIGKSETAERIYRRAMEIARSLNNPLLYATLANNLGVLYWVRKDFAQTLPLWKEALDIRLGSLNEDHPDVAHSIDAYVSVLGILVPEQAIPLLEGALQIRRRKFGENHQNTALSLNSLGFVHFINGDSQLAETYFRKAFQARLNVLGRYHPDQALALTNLAQAIAAQGRIPEARKHLIDAAEIHDQLIDRIFALASERQRMEFLARLEGGFHSYVAIVYRFLAGDAQAVAELFDVVLRRKGIGAEALGIQKSAVLGGRYPHLSAGLGELNRLEAQIAHLVLDPPKEAGTESTLAALNEKWEGLQAELARQIPEMRPAAQLQNAHAEALAGALPEHSALVEFLRFQEMELPAAGDRGPRPVTPHYVAFVLLAGKPVKVKLVDLGPAAEIERKLETWRTVTTGGSIILQAGRSDDQPSPSMDLRQGLLEISRQVGTHTPSNTLQGGMEAGTVLRQAVFDPLLPALAGSIRLFLAPDGNLARLPFEALPLDDQRCLIDEYRISYLSAGRDVLRFGRKHISPPGPPLVISAPDYDLGGTSWQNVQPGIPFLPLEGARQEGERTAAALQASFWAGAQAVESALKQQRSPQVLHISTHGFFIEEAPAIPGSETMLPSPIAPGHGRLAHLRGVQNPLLRSGLALAGANVWIQQGTPPEEAEDGLLNAVDVSALDLLDTDLVVLSACDTGLGWVQSGEGVFGLRRAFAIAGARTLVMSLWKVPDEATRQLMDLFYTYLTTHKLGPAEALRQAQLSMKGKYKNPFYWGAFICQGDPSPLRVEVQFNSHSSNKNR